MLDLFRQLVARMNRRYSCRPRVSGDGAPYTRKLRLERLETRELLDVSLPVAESALVERTAIVAQVAPSEPVALVALRNEPSTEISFNLVESSTLDFGAASEDAGFVIDGVRYESYETLRTRPLNFGASDSVDSSPTPLDSQLGASPMGLRSGGGSGEPETWNIEVTSTLSSSLSDLSDEYTNPLLEHRSGWSGGMAGGASGGGASGGGASGGGASGGGASGGGTPLSETDHLVVKFPGIPVGYLADITIPEDAFSRASFYIRSDSFYSALNDGFQFFGVYDCYIYIVPKNNAVVDGNAPITLTMSEPYLPYSSGGGSVVEYDFNLVSTSATATIVDDDRWRVIVEASDANATERLPDVAPDYGYYTFSRVHDDPDIPGDTTYPITVYFDVLEAPYSLNYCPVYGVDYTLSASSVDASDERTYMDNFSYVGRSSVYSAGQFREYRRQFVGEIPSAKTSCDLRMEAFFDWDDEGELWHGEDEVNPGDQQNEIATLTVTSVSGFGGSEWNGKGIPDSAEIHIRDGAVSHLVQDGEIIDDGEGYLTPNTDDDNENGSPDCLDEGTVANEDDVVKLVNCVWFDLLERIDGGYYFVSVALDLIGTGIQAWRDSGRTSAYSGDSSGSAYQYTYSPTQGSYTEGYNCLWLEVWFEEWIYTSVESSHELMYAVGEGGIFNFGGRRKDIVAIEKLPEEQRVDVDIDIKNIGRGGNYQPDSSAEGEEFENSEFAIGKIMRPIALDDYTTPFYEIDVEIFPDENADFNSIMIEFDYPMYGNPRQGLEGLRTNPFGELLIWNVQNRSELDYHAVSDGGNLIGSVNDVWTIEYSASELGFSETITRKTFYVQPVTLSRIVKHTDLNSDSNGEHCITVSVDYGDKNYSDSVRFVVSDAGMLHYEMMSGSNYSSSAISECDLLSAFASDLIYKRKDSIPYGLELLKEEQLISLGITNSDVKALLLDKKWLTGLCCGIYREYITGRYILAFAGTKLTSLPDWLNNINQALGINYTPQYYKAKLIAIELRSNPNFQNGNLWITGHSLGGGLASNAAVISGFNAHTFNAAGLRANTPLNGDDPTASDESLINYEYETRYQSAAEFINAYHVEGDILTEYQIKFHDYIPIAIGNSISIMCDITREEALRNFELGKQCHYMKNVIIGMERLHGIEI